MRKTEIETLLKTMLRTLLKTVLEALRPPSTSLCRALIAASCVLCSASAAHADEVRLPLSTYQEAEDRLDALKAASIDQGHEEGATAVIAAAHYVGRVEKGHLRLTATFSAHLPAVRGYKTVPLLGQDAVILSAKQGTESIALMIRDGMWVWPTAKNGDATIQIEFLTAPTGPRGSVEYRFGIAETSVTDLRIFFPQKDLSPVVTGAVVTERREVTGGIELHAVLPPIAGIHIVGFHEVDDSLAASKAQLYGQTMNLVSVSDDALEVFSVISYAILYAPTKHFEIEIPSGYEILSADGQGAFRYTITTQEGRTTLHGETADGIRQRYEISLRLRRALAATESELRVPIPKLQGVERDSGTLAIEAPGRLSVERAEGDGLMKIDARELPDAILASSVSPVTQAFRYASPPGIATIWIGRYPEKTLATSSVDRLEMSTVATRDGERMTQMTFELRNNLRQHLALTVPEGAEIKSATLDDAPIKLSRDATGRVLVPLVRSRVRAGRLMPLRIRMVVSTKSDRFGLVGSQHFAVPRVDIPISSLSWSIHLPTSLAHSAFDTGVSNESIVRDASWFQPPPAPYDALDQHNANWTEVQAQDVGNLAGSMADSDTSATHQQGSVSGTVPVRLRTPARAPEITYRRFWIEADEPIEGSIYYVHRSFQALGQAGLALCIFLLLALAPLRLKSPTSTRVVVATASIVLIACFGWPVWLLLAILALSFVAWRRGWFKAAKKRVHARWVSTIHDGQAYALAIAHRLTEDFSQRRSRSVAWAILAPIASVAWITFKVMLLTLMLSILMGQLASLRWILPSRLP
ncbi:MAG: hypothetical protein IPK13_03600 [Deltaproteobacteria bacterium]|nr:hypothetical protein [Deltaproteobacteria bacterium]